ncbi:uncharacterized protein LOC108824827 [Raphanus sativus]|uniref:Uncharacterized protein LOC108824827 n=1 Tax=Raphanus sativus TaxID=3726 RepID=A0A9W3CGY5_RAPSA|nr:uncharacterized protein LOC108824827 [Raphanus sativus]
MSRLSRILPVTTIVDHPTSAAYPEEFIASAREVALLRQDNWNTIIQERIHRSVDRILRRDWDSSIPSVGVPGKRRLSLFTPRVHKLINKARKMRPHPNLSELIRVQLNLPRADPPRRVSAPVVESAPPEVPRDGSPVHVEDSPTEDPAVEVQQVGAVSEDAPVITPDPSKKKGKKRSRHDSSAEGDQEDGPIDRPETEGPPKKKKKKGAKAGQEPLPQEKTGPREGEGDDGEEAVAEPSEEAEEAVAEPTEEAEEASPEAQLQLNRRKKKTCPSEGNVRSEDPPAPASTVAPVQPSTSKAPAGRSSVPRRGPPEFPDQVRFEYDGTTPLIYAPDKCAELVSQINGGPRPLLLNDLIFKKEYTDAAQAKLRGDGSMNFVVELYDTELKASRIKLRRSEKLVAAKDAFIRRKKFEWTEETDKLKVKASRAISRRKAQKEKLDATEAALGAAQETVGILETDIALMKEREEEAEKEQARIVEQHEKKIKQQAMEIERLKRSRVFEVMQERIRVQTEMIAKCNRRFRNIMDREKRRGPFDDATAMYNQSFGTRSCLEVLLEAGRDIPHDTIDMFAVWEEEYDQKAKELDVGEIPEDDLTLSPLVLPSPYVDERVLPGLNTFGSNASLIDPADGAALSDLVAEGSGERGLGEGSSRAIVSSDDPAGVPASGGQLAEEEPVLDPAEKGSPILVVSDTSAEDRTDDQNEEEAAVDQRIPPPMEQGSGLQKSPGTDIEASTEPKGRGEDGERGSEDGGAEAQRLEEQEPGVIDNLAKE